MGYTEITALWQGFTGSPGYTRVKFDGLLDEGGAQAATARLRTFFSGMTSILPDDVQIGFTEAGRLYNDAGVLVGEVDQGTHATVVGQSVGSFSSPSGAVINWLTAAFQRGRRLRGRTFIVPLAGSAYDASGSLAGTTITSLSTAAETLIGGTPGVIIASRRADGFYLQAIVTGSSVPDRAAVLRSRRD